MEELLGQTIIGSKKYNEKYIEKLFDIICSYYNIGYINLSFKNTANCLGYFIKRDNTVNININLIKNYYNNISKKYGIEKSKYFLGLGLLNILLHEIEHVRQNKVLMYNDDLEGLILYNKIMAYSDLIDTINNSTSKIELKFKKIFIHDIKMNKLYKYSPDERLANIKSLKKVTKIALSLDDINSYYMFRDMELVQYIDGYLKRNKILYKGPTKYFFNKIDINNTEWIDSFSKDLDTMDKMKYGLSINDDDIELWKEYVNGNEVILKYYKK